MAKSNSSTALTHRIEQLLQARQAHAEALIQIEETLQRVGAALGASVGRKPGRPSAAASGASAAASGGGKGRRRRRRGKFSVSGEESVLTFIRSKKNPSTQDVNRHWKGEGRGGTADNTLTKLVKEKRLKRQSIEGQRGSTYGAA